MKKGKNTTSGRINSALIYHLLLENASEIRPLKITSKKEDATTIASLLRDEGVFIDQHTIAENLKAMQAKGLVDIAGDKKRGKWYATKEYLDEESRKILLMSLYSNNSLGRSQIEGIRDNLIPVIGEASIKELEGTFPKAKPYWNKNISSHIYTIDDAIRDNKQVEYINGIFDYEGKKIVPNPDPKKGKPRRVSPIGVVNSRGSLYMLVTDDSHKEESFIRLDNICTIKKTSVPRHIKKDFVIEEFLDHRPYLSKGDINKYELIVEGEEEKGSPAASLSFVLQYFGIDTEIFEKDGKLHAIIETNEFSFKYWYVQYGDCFTIVSPQSVKEVIKDYLKAIEKKL